VRDTPLVSVVVPTFDRAHSIGAALDSVLAQTYPSVETIVVDDGSTDGTSEVLAGYGDRIRVLRQQNRGPSCARNTGIRAATGRIAAFLDSDDLWMPCKLERQVAVMLEHGERAPCCIVNARMVSTHGGSRMSFDLARLKPRAEQGLWINVLEVLSTRFLFFTQAVAVWRSALERVGGFDEGLWTMEDHDMALRLALEGPWGYVREPLVVYHQDHPTSLATRARRNPTELHASTLRVLDRARSSPGCGPFVQRNLERAVRRTRRLERASELRTRGTPLDGPVAWALEASVRLENAVTRRLGLWPPMRCAATHAPPSP